MLRSVPRGVTVGLDGIHDSLYNDCCKGCIRTFAAVFLPIVWKFGK